MSVLSERTDGVGFFYGYYKTDSRQINVRLEEVNSTPAFVAYVGGVKIAAELSKGEAEKAAIKWINEHPE